MGHKSTWGHTLDYQYLTIKQADLFFPHQAPGGEYGRGLNVFHRHLTISRKAAEATEEYMHNAEWSGCCC
jgi:hypothetical protein